MGDVDTTAISHAYAPTFVDSYFDRLPATYRGSAKAWAAYYYVYSYGGTVHIRLDRPAALPGTISILVYDHYHEIGTWEHDTPLEPLFESAWAKINELLKADVEQTRERHLDAKARLRAFLKLQPDQTWWDRLNTPMLEEDEPGPHGPTGSAPQGPQGAGNIDRT